MSLLLNEEQQMVADGARQLLESMAPVARIRDLRDASLGYDAQLWHQMVEMGWPSIQIPEAYGGLGYGYRGLGILLQESGRTLSSSPLISSVLAGTTLLIRAGSEAQKQVLLPALAEGSLRMTVAMDETNHHDPASVRMTAVRVGDDYVLDGTKIAVMDADTADKIVVVARNEVGEWLLLLLDARADGISRDRMHLSDERSYCRMCFDGVRVPACERLSGNSASGAALQFTLDAINIGLAAEMYGLAQACFERTVDYLKDREQFGVPIGSFQALQHRAAHMLTELEQARSAVLVALQALDDANEKGADVPLSAIASACKVKLSRVAHLVTTEAIQLHGGMGMTDELDIGFYIKRARVAQQLFGDRQYHVDRYATLRGY